MSIFKGHFISLDALKQHEIENIDSVLGPLSCCKKILQIGWIINNGNLFLTFLEAGSVRSRCQYGRVLAEILV